MSPAQLSVVKEYRPIITLRTSRFVVALMFGLAANAGAQAVGSRFPTVLWASCAGDAASASTDDGPITLHDLAVRARPALWFSRDEPLIDLDGPLPREWPRRQARDATPEDLVYYRVTKIKSATSDLALADALRTRLAGDRRQYVTSEQANPEAIATLPLDTDLLDQMSEVVIRYLFYYPNELGAHSHAHDLESVELRIVFEMANQRGDPRASNPQCRQIRVATFYGAAHGLGLYTNTLDLDVVLRDRLDETAEVVEATSRPIRLQPGQAGVAPPGAPESPVLNRLTRSDPFWPLMVMVEEGKHASAPDRNGDGVFTPNFDVNKFAADAWGVRDTMRSRQLSPVFRSDTFKQRIPQITVDDNGTLRPAQTQDSWAQQTFSRYVRYDYRLRRPTEDRDICGEPLREEKAREESMKEYAAALLRVIPQGDPEGLLAGKAFCDDVVVQDRVSSIDVLGHLGFGGAYNGFTHWWERISASARFDGGVGWVATIPVGIRVPGLGGWIVGRVSGPWPGVETRHSADVAYMPSASRFADWYVAAGMDYGHYESPVEVEDGTRSAVETGVKFRFPMPEWGTFFGGRIGIRANGRSMLERQRLVFEFGAGIW
jgi:hypothetical protein